jgi:TatD DNase family protein
LPKLYDTHCHLNLPEAFPDPLRAVEEARAAGVELLNVVGIDVDGSRRALRLAEECEGVYAVVGVHPNSAETWDLAARAEIASLLKHPKAVALGEIGLDYHWDLASREAQRACLLDQLDLARDQGKPVVFHCREAYGDLLAILEQRDRQPYLFHCFSGSKQDAAGALALGGVLGFDGPVTYRNAGVTRDILKETPRDRIVLETDSPYLTPEPHRGRPNKPAYLGLINAAVARALGIDAPACAALTTANARRYFGV